MQQDAPLMTVVDLSALEIEFRVAESLRRRRSVSACPAEITYGGKTYAGEVTAISPEVKPGRGHGRVRFRGTMPRRACARTSASPCASLMDRRDGVLKVERGAFYEAGGGAVRLRASATASPSAADPDRRRERARRRDHRGLAEGDQVVISDTDSFKMPRACCSRTDRHPDRQRNMPMLEMHKLPRPIAPTCSRRTRCANSA